MNNWANPWRYYFCAFFSGKRAWMTRHSFKAFTKFCMRWTWNKDEKPLAKGISQIELRGFKRKGQWDKDSGSLPFSLLSVSSVICDFHINIWVTLNNLEACSDTTGCEAEWRSATDLIVCLDMCVFQVALRISIRRALKGIENAIIYVKFSVGKIGSQMAFKTATCSHEWNLEKY